MNKELKPCPFCGGEAYLSENTPSTANFNDGAVHFSVSCGSFGCQVLPKANLWQCTPEEAIIAWNTRPSMNDHAEEMYELLSAIAKNLNLQSISGESSLPPRYRHEINKLLTKARGQHD